MNYPAPKDGMVDGTTVDPAAVEEPVTLHRIMQSMIGQGLRERYAAPQKLSHELFVLLMQLKENENRARKARPKQKAKTAPPPDLPPELMIVAAK
jgi:hypothetical protein